MVHVIILRDQGQPLTCINYFSRACNYNLAVVTPTDLRAAAWHLNLDSSLGFVLDHRSHRGCTGTGSGRGSFSDAAFPDTQFYVAAILDAHKNHVGAFRELFMILD